MDGNIEFYCSILVCGLATLGVWEFLKWLVDCVRGSRDEAAGLVVFASHICSAATKNPEAAVKLTGMSERYLAATKTLGLTYVGVNVHGRLVRSAGRQKSCLHSDNIDWVVCDMA